MIPPSTPEPSSPSEPRGPLAERPQRTTRKLALAVAPLPLLQLSREAFKGIVFTVVDRTVLADTVASSAFMAAAIAATVAYAGRKGVELRVLPDPFPKTYAILTVALAGLFAATIAISERSAASLASLVYNAVITVACEELIFRGLVYRLSERHEGDRHAVALSSLLFGLWHLGYADTVLWRTSMFFPEADVLQIMASKALTGLLLGIVLGTVRHRCGSVYPAMLLHSAVNVLGG